MEFTTHYANLVKNSLVAFLVLSTAVVVFHLGLPYTLVINGICTSLMLLILLVALVFSQGNLGKGISNSTKFWWGVAIFCSFNIGLFIVNKEYLLILGFVFISVILGFITPWRK